MRWKFLNRANLLLNHYSTTQFLQKYITKTRMLKIIKFSNCDVNIFWGLLADYRKIYIYLLHEYFIFVVRSAEKVGTKRYTFRTQNFFNIDHQTLIQCKEWKTYTYRHTQLHTHKHTYTHPHIQTLLFRCQSGPRHRVPVSRCHMAWLYWRTPVRGIPKSELSCATNLKPILGNSRFVIRLCCAYEPTQAHTVWSSKLRVDIHKHLPGGRWLWTRPIKHTDTPTHSHINKQMHAYVCN